MIRWFIIILVALAMGAVGYYYIYPSVEAPQAVEKKQAVSVEESADLEAELEATSVEGLDVELGDIDRELSQ